VVDAAVSRLPRWVVVGVAWALLGSFAAADHASDALVVFTDFYLIPVAVVSWYSGPIWGAMTSALATIGWAADDLPRFGLLEHPWTYVWDVASQLAFFLLVALLVYTLRERLRVEATLARVDSLTQLANRRAFEEACAQETRRCQRYGKPFSVAYLDVDDFKRVNDANGHSAGDRLLVCLADTLRNNTRAADTVGRMGGDEFVVLLPETNQTQARSAVQNIRERLGEFTCTRGLRVTFSVGVVTFAQPPDTGEEMLHQVDQVMYQVKRAQKDSVHYAIWPGEDASELGVIPAARSTGT
jgi:diguanylate cyclase (GGDEF)-like protein